MKESEEHWTEAKSFYHWDRGRVTRVRLRMPKATSATGPGYVAMGFDAPNQDDPERVKWCLGRPAPTKVVVQENLAGLPGLKKTQPSRAVLLDDGRIVPLRLQDLESVWFVVE